MKNNKFLNSTLNFLLKVKEYLIIAVIYITLASQKISNFGLNYDELLFTNVALGERAKDFFISHRLDVFGTLIPLHTYYYIGILKSAIYAPIFAIFGTSAFTIRFPVILLTTGSLFLIFGLLRNHFGKRMSLLITLITGLSTDLIFHTTYDVGPVAIEMFCKILLIVIMLSYLKLPKLWKILSFALVFFAGTFNKVNFLWSGNSVLAVFAVVYLFNYLQLPKLLGKKRAISHLVIFLFGVSLSYIYWRWCGQLYNWTTSLGVNSVLQNYPARSYNVLSMTGGWNFFMWAIEVKDPIFDYVFASLFGAFVMIFSFLGFLIVLFNEKFARIRQFFVLFYGMFWLTFAQQLATDSAGNPWHTFSSVFPFVPVCFGISIWAFWTLIFQERKVNSVINSLTNSLNSDKVENENIEPKNVEKTVESKTENKLILDNSEIEKVENIKEENGEKDETQAQNLKSNSKSDPKPNKLRLWKNSLQNSAQKFQKTKLGTQIDNFKLSNIAIALSILLVFSYQISVYSVYYNALNNEPKYSAFSLEFQKLSDYLKNQDKKVVVTDWGPMSGIMTLDPIKDKYFDYWNGIGGDYNPSAFEGFEQKFLGNYQDHLVLAHGKERRIFRNTDNLEIFLSQKGFKLVKVKSFPGGRGVQYELFEIQKL